MESHRKATYLVVGAEHDVSFTGATLFIFVLVLRVRIIEVTIDGLGIHDSRVRRSRLGE